MNIVYGAAGEGRGHAARAAALWPLLSENLNLSVWCPESIAGFMQEKCPQVSLEKIPGIPLLNLNNPAVVRRYFSLLPDTVSTRYVASYSP